MPLDYNSLLMALGFAGIGLCLTTVVSWLSSRTDAFLLTWALGMLMIVAHVFTYSVYIENPQIELQTAAYTLLVGGFSILIGAARQICGGRVDWPKVVATAAIATAIIGLPNLFGLDGLATILCNLVAAALLFYCGYRYLEVRPQAPVPVTVISLLYALIGLSFIPCAFVLVWTGQFRLAGPPINLAEDLNLIAGIVGLTGIGALSLALDQWRRAGRHRLEANTDQLTRLLNRRALFEEVGSRLDPKTAVLLFDLDHFKSINDLYGHAVGDEVLRRFADLLRNGLRKTDLAARLGGEEFVAVLPDATAVYAHQAAERLRKAFQEIVFQTTRGPLQCTVSIGIAFPSSASSDLGKVLVDADIGLYRAKRGGRNRVASASLRLAG